MHHIHSCVDNTGSHSACMQTYICSVLGHQSHDAFISYLVKLNQNCAEIEFYGYEINQYLS
jgi:hypothetical protein